MCVLMLVSDYEALITSPPCAGVLDWRWVIVPAPSPAPARHKTLHPRCAGCLAVAAHTLRDARETAARGDSEDSEAAADYAEVAEVAAGSYSRGRAGRGLGRRRGKVYPELLVVVDHTLFSKFELDAEAARKYVISYINAVNMRFRTFYQPMIELQLAGVMLGRTKSSFPFISSAIRHGDMLDAPAALHAMGQYYYKDRWEIGDIV